VPLERAGLKSREPRLLGSHSASPRRLPSQQRQLLWFAQVGRSTAVECISKASRASHDRSTRIDEASSEQGDYRLGAGWRSRPQEDRRRRVFREIQRPTRWHLAGGFRSYLAFCTGHLACRQRGVMRSEHRGGRSALVSSLRSTMSRHCA
jgi:hypothetical protein